MRRHFLINNYGVTNTVFVFHSSRDIVCKFGIWDQIRVDYGREWYLMLYVNQMVASMRNDTQRPPHMQTSSKQVTPCYQMEL